MPSARDIRASAWRAIKEGGLLPALAGFAIISMLSVVVQVAVRRIGLSQGWVVEIPFAEFLRSFGFAVDPEAERLLSEYAFPKTEPAFLACSTALQTAWAGILSFGGAVLSVAVMRGGAMAYQALSGFRWFFRTAALGLLRMALLAFWTLLFVVPGVMAAYSYRMAFMLMADHPDWSPAKALSESRRIMHGHRWRLACLDASFIGWFVLVGATFGLAGIFVAPYFAAANAAFYEDLLDRVETNAGQ